VSFRRLQLRPRSKLHLGNRSKDKKEKDNRPDLFLKIVPGQLSLQ
jgi:hypothetical protein